MMKSINFNEKNLVEEINALPPRTEILTIPVERQAREDGSPLRYRSGILTAGFEYRELHSGPHSMYQIRFLPLHWVDRTEDLTAFVNHQKFTPRRSGSHDSFLLVVNRDERQVKFGPDGNIVVRNTDLRGLGIASYAFGELIRWAQASYADFTVHPIKVGSGDAWDPVNRERRNHFYEKHGFRGTFHDANCSDGSYSIDTVADLIASPVPAGWEKHDQYEMLAQLLEDVIVKDIKIVKADNRSLFAWNQETRRSYQLKRFQKISAGLGVSLLVLLFWLTRI